MNSDDARRKELTKNAAPRWQCIALAIAGVQCLIWGVAIIFWPAKSALAYGFAKPPTELFLWQGTGLVIVLFGIGYVIASTNPLQHWLIVLIGFLEKSLGPIGMSWSAYHGQVSPKVLYLIPFNDLIWLIPFGLILQRVRSLRK